MIDYVSGKLAAKKPTEAVIDVGGIGYKVLIPTSTFEKLPAIGKEVAVLTHHYVREDAMTLFGFATPEERTVFNLMLAVSGVGPKLALAALSALRPSEIRDRVLEGDSAMLTRIPGVGKKTAERLIIELRDRFEKTALGSSTITSADTPTVSYRADALAALEALGLSRSGAEKAILTVLRTNPDISSAEELIRLALRA
ncbi:MAG: Holliday junction branch migration protein RuvA [Bacteroidetes Order II. Incertae sedis bacterium]|jgi:holliday junction DNA helicase RuvA|nr:Holliday junction branch migration protein RuvA [Bacteroidetes Order II. bacterium]MBT4051746.1 Holliday junction branch migration protein RuvA [Bacteroidetes Order II. bacterium]MBT4603478.1 Holliday junction branch migration protein RuvA [Bacteroidetes Order II. bacterium]MBT5249206.1 Holliday junction branch migration protein RuvA [Bacteroidetes Order II. bacterium]MBT6199568.1 Holliday junction branch migration protein RuvA [Bacteroidetes Order II. bacterium]